MLLNEKKSYKSAHPVKSSEVTSIKKEWRGWNYLFIETFKWYKVEQFAASLHVLDLDNM